MDELEDLLRRYRPIGPPHELRDRVVRPRPRRGAWIYPIAAAAAAAAFYALTDSTHRRVISATSLVNAEREAAIAEMATDLGGSDGARLEAERLTDSESPGIDPQLQDIVGIEERTP